jgi:hypothetical protein
MMANVVCKSVELQGLKSNLRWRTETLMSSMMLLLSYNSVVYGFHLHLLLVASRNTKQVESSSSLRITHISPHQGS